MDLFSVCSFVKHSGSTVAKEADYIAIGHCIETVANFTENFSNQDSNFLVVSG